MKQSLVKIRALFGLKLRLMLVNANIMLAPLLAIGFVIVMKVIMAKQIAAVHELAPFYLNLGLLFNIVMGGVMMASYPLAEEKEHHTLRVLMTSSVTGIEYFIGSLLPSVLIIMMTNFILIPVSGSKWSQVPVVSYFLITLMATLISLILGYIVGIEASSQNQAGILCMPVMLIFTMIPSFQMLSSALKRINEYLFTGQLTRLVDGIYSSSGFHWRLTDGLVFVTWLAVCSAIFLYAYRCHGLDRD